MEVISFEDFALSFQLNTHGNIYAKILRHYGE
jgi:hypothetical protein